jgi:hypothetical protein
MSKNKTADRDEILEEAIRLHDLRFGRGCCERKYIYSCPNLQGVIMEAGQNVRQRPPTSDHI